MCCKTATTETRTQPFKEALNMADTYGDEEFTDEELAELFGEQMQTAPAANENSADNLDDKVETTKAFSNRLRERTDKAVDAERERIATKMGYSSYEEMMKTQEDKQFIDQGINPDKARPIVDQMVKEQLAQTPEMQELETLRQEKLRKFAEDELKALGDLVGQEFTSLDQVPKDVIDDWKTSGSLKQSYMKLHGEELIRKTRKGINAGTTQHMQSTGVGNGNTGGGRRLIREDELTVWRQMFPGKSDDELRKMTVPR